MRNSVSEEVNCQLNTLVNISCVHLGIDTFISEKCVFAISEKAACLRIGEGVYIREHCSFTIGNLATLDIGSQVFIQKGCVVSCKDTVSIGEGSLLMKGVKIYDHNKISDDNDGDNLDDLVKGKEFRTAPVIIGKNCWMGHNTVIMPGVTIGNNVIIDTGCIIDHDVPDNATIISPQVWKDIS